MRRSQVSRDLHGYCTVQRLDSAVPEAMAPSARTGAAPAPSVPTGTAAQRGGLRVFQRRCQRRGPDRQARLRSTRPAGGRSRILLHDCGWHRVWDGNTVAGLPWCCMDVLLTLAVASSCLGPRPSARTATSGAGQQAAERLPVLCYRHERRRGNRPRRLRQAAVAFWIRPGVLRQRRSQVQGGQCERRRPRPSAEAL
jgi:hypothetical protein